MPVRSSAWSHGLRSALLVLPLLASGCAGSAESATGPTATFTAQEQEGRRLFATHCASCHSTIPDSTIVGPSLAGVAGRADRRMEGVDAGDYLRMSIQDPGAYVVDGYADLMPPEISKSLSEEDIDAIVAYLMSLEE